MAVAIKPTLLPLPGTPSTHLCPIKREAREAAEKAIAALRELREADPYVHAALVEAHYYKRDALPTTIRGQVSMVRERAHSMKVEAVEAAMRKVRERDAPPAPKTFAEGLEAVKDSRERASLVKKWIAAARGELAENRLAGITMTADCVNAVYGNKESTRLFLSKAIDFADENADLTFAIAGIVAFDKGTLPDLKEFALSELEMVEQYLAEQEWEAGGRQGPVPRASWERNLSETGGAS